MAALAGDYVQVLVGGYDLTGDMNSLAIADALDMYDVTVFGDQAHKVLPGLRRRVIGHNGYFDANAGASHPLLRQVSVAGGVSVFLGQNTAPIAGDPVYSLDGIEGQYTVSPEINKTISFGGMFAQRSGQGGWGVALAAQATFTNTTTGTVVDNGAASANGGSAFLHVLQAAASDTYTVTIEGATNLAFTTGIVTLATFTLNASQVGSEAVSIAGTIPQYTRFKAVRTGSAGNTIKISASLIRF
ncbi:MAG: hypothetical protein ABI700_02155 [Chloroflexota bacterium]